MENLNKDLFDNKNPKVISIVGAGGKTSCIRQLADDYLRGGKRVIVTTTTRIYEPKEQKYFASDLEAIRRNLDEFNFAVAGVSAEEKKIKGVCDEVFSEMTGLADVVLNEADGSRHLPLKAPIYGEPVLPEQTDMMVVVAGMSCLNRPLSEVVFRTERVKEILNTDDNHLITPADVARVLWKGYLKNRAYPAVVLLNQVDTEKLKEKAEKVAFLLPSFRCVMTSLKDVMLLF